MYVSIPLESKNPGDMNTFSICERIRETYDGDRAELGKKSPGA
jgi:hypothetical protein